MNGKELKMLAAISVIALITVASCAEFQEQTPTVQGGAVGAGVGGLAGALLDSHNPWRGGIIGGALGAVLGGTLGQISDHASREAATVKKPVEYRTENGRGYVREEPLSYDAATKCRRVRERVYEDGRLVRSHIKEICDVDE
ncbi:MAG TPA: YMGG-like glycine zipper-containing protein [Syntrophorhabdaceae bacterium]|nr:YMGG-like glycine zipper-containing protein [Syntrophorhabdaceae bacterium]